MRAMFLLPADMKLGPDEKVEINRLNNQVVVQYHEPEWKRFSR